MKYLTQDGKLDIARIDNLPLEEFIEVVESLSPEQYKEFSSYPRDKETQMPAHAVEVEFTLDDMIERGCVLADDLLDKLRKNTQAYAKDEVEKE